MSNSRPGLDAPTRALVTLAAAIARGEEHALGAQMKMIRAEDVPAVWVEELVLQSVLMVGWPRALTAAALWRSAAGDRAVAPIGVEDFDYAAAPDWIRRGEVLCRRIYADNYDKLRANVRALHPALDAWMIAEGYGRTLARPGLDARRRELCVVAQTAVIGASRQLLSHLIGALNVGASTADIDDSLDASRPFLQGDGEKAAHEVWARVRAQRRGAP